MLENFSEIAHDMRRAIERERERLMERIEEQNTYLKLLDNINQLLSANADLKETINRQTADIDALHEQLQQERGKSEELEMRLSELAKLSAGMARKSSQDELLKAIRVFVNKSKRKKIEKRIAVKEMVLEMANANGVVLPEDLAATIDALDDEQPEAKVVNVQGNYNDIHDNGSVNKLATGR